MLFPHRAALAGWIINGERYEWGFEGGDQNKEHPEGMTSNFISPIRVVPPCL